MILLFPANDTKHAPSGGLWCRLNQAVLINYKRSHNKVWFCLKCIQRRILVSRSAVIWSCLPSVGPVCRLIYENEDLRRLVLTVRCVAVHSGCWRFSTFLNKSEHGRPHSEFSQMLMKVLSHPGPGKSKCCIVGDWACFSFSSHPRCFFSSN